MHQHRYSRYCVEGAAQQGVTRRQREEGRLEGDVSFRFLPKVLPGGLQHGIAAVCGSNRTFHGCEEEGIPAGAAAYFQNR